MRTAVVSGQSVVVSDCADGWVVTIEILERDGLYV